MASEVRPFVADYPPCPTGCPIDHHGLFLHTSQGSNPGADRDPETILRRLQPNPGGIGYREEGGSRVSSQDVRWRLHDEPNLTNTLRTVADYGRPLQFGVSLAPAASDLKVILDTVDRADGSLDLVGIQDHPYQRRFLDTMQLLGTVAEQTDRLRVFPDVACLPLRPPAMLASQAASIDIMSGGRFELGLGAGAFWDAIVGMGGPRRSPGEALAALEEAVAIIRLLWTGERGLRFDGEHYAITGIHSGPVPVHDIEIWFGVYGPRACQLLGRVADGWIPSLGRSSLTELDSRHRMIDESALEAGRDPADIRRLVNIGGVITDGAIDGPWNGPVEQWVERLTDLTRNNGFDSFIFWPEDDPVDQVGRFSDVSGQVREAVAAERD